MEVENTTKWANASLYLPPHIWQDYLQIGLLLSLVIVGVPLNVFSLLKTLLKRRGRRELRFGHMTTLKLHVATIDLLILFLYALTRAIWVATIQWLAGDIFCKLSKFGQTFALCSNSYMVAVLALHRLHTVANVHRVQVRGKSRKTFQKWINLSYLLAMLFSLPQLYVWQTINPFPIDPDWYQCVTVWIGEKVSARSRNVTLGQSYYAGEQIYSFYHMVVTFYVPFLVTIVAYITVWFKFRQSIKRAKIDLILANRRRTMSAATNLKRYGTIATTRTSEDNAHVYDMMELMVVLKAPELLAENELPTLSFSLARLMRARSRAVKKGAYLIAAYVVLWCPYNVLSLITFIKPSLISAYSLWKLVYDLIVVNAVLNPFIYGL